jgi:hypothetical protein
MIVDQVQVFDQQIAPAWSITQQHLDLRKRYRIDAAAFRRLALAFLRHGRRRGDDGDDSLIHAGFH